MTARTWRDFVEWVDGLMKRYMDTGSLPRARAEITLRIA